jgi:hypothetical protein
MNDSAIFKGFRHLCQWMGACAVLAGTAVAADAPAGPQIQFEETVHACGQVVSGQPVNFVFKFSNPGDRPLEISAVQPGCGCTVPGEWPRRLEPGKSGGIPITFTMTGEGPILKAVTVSSNDPAKPTVTLQISGTLWMPILATPAAVVFNTVEGDAGAASQTVRLLNRTDNAVVLSEPVSSNGTLSAHIKTLKPGKEFDLVIEPLPGKPLVPGNSMISVKTDLKEAPSLVISAITSVVPAVVVSPDRVYLPGEVLSADAPFRVMVRGNVKDALEVSDLAVSDPKITVKMTEQEPGRVFCIDGKVPGGYKLDAAKPPMISFATTHPGYAHVEVPLVPPPGRAMMPGQPGQPASATPPGVPAVPAPRLAFSNERHDFGEVKEGQTPEHEFLFTNEEQEAVDIASVQPCANKGSVISWSRRVEPGKTGTVNVRMDTAGLAGPVDIAFLVMAGKSSAPAAELHLRAMVVKPAEKPAAEKPAAEKPAAEKPVRKGASVKGKPARR